MRGFMQLHVLLLLVLCMHACVIMLMFTMDMCAGWSAVLPHAVAVMGSISCTLQDMLVVVHNATFMVLTALHASLQPAHCRLHPRLPHLSSCRQLAHRSFQTPKWLEYALSYCGVLAVEGDPIEWVSAHRYHHLHCDTPLDPHSPYEGFWWSHMGWLLDNKVRLACRTLQVD
jgi:hypothetical protein